MKCVRAHTQNEQSIEIVREEKIMNEEDVMRSSMYVGLKLTYDNKNYNVVYHILLIILLFATFMRAKEINTMLLQKINKNQ